MVTNRNLSANFEQMYADYFADTGRVPPPDTTVVSWLPFYHDMGLLLGICVPILGGLHSVFMSPMSFLQRPARWIQLLASHSRAMTAAPNFAFELAVRRTTDEDMAGLDLGNVLGLLSGSERVHAATLRRFTDRFARYGFRDTAIRPSYGLAEATVYVATRRPGDPPEVVHFESEKLSGGTREAVHERRRHALVSYGTPESTTVRIVDPRPTPSVRRERPVRSGCTARTSPWATGTNPGNGAHFRWPARRCVARHTGKAMAANRRSGVHLRGRAVHHGPHQGCLIVYGRNHYPEDIEATIQEITGGRCAAISVSDARTEKLVAIVELKKRGDSEEETRARLDAIKGEVTSAIQSHTV